MRPVVLLTMAGRSERFARVGVGVPKWALRLGGKTVLERAIESAAPLLEAGSELRLVVRPDDASSVLLHDTLRASPWPATVLTGSGRAEGQAVDALAGLGPGDDDRPLVVWCVDTFVNWTTETTADLLRAEGNWLLTAALPGDHWSFASTGPDDRVTATAEKRRIGEDASVGMYAFATGRLFREAVSAGAPDAGERYVAPLYNHLVRLGGCVRVIRVPREAVVSVGTPDEMLAACAANDWEAPPELRAYARSRR